MKHELTDLDSSQCVRYTYDKQAQAQRVVITGASGIAESISEALKDLKIDVKMPEMQEVKTGPTLTFPKMPDFPKIIEVEKVVIQNEIKIVEVPTEKVIIQTEYREIEKPVVVKEIEIIKCEIPVIQKEIQVIEIPKYDDKMLKIIVFVNSLATIGLLTLNYFKH